jgi:adenylate kinase family enzyme
LNARRILIYGVTGSGKSTLAKTVADKTGLPCVIVDDLTWEPGWKPVPPEVQCLRFEEVCAGESWILDTAYSFWRETAVERAELIVALDYPRWLSFARLLRRTVRRIVDGKPVCNGNRESLRTALSFDSILIWHFKSFNGKRQRIRQWVQEGRNIVVHRSPGETQNWLESLPQNNKSVLR